MPYLLRLVGYINAERVVKYRNMYLTVVEDTSLIRNQLYLEVRSGKNVAKSNEECPRYESTLSHSPSMSTPIVPTNMVKTVPSG